MYLNVPFYFAQLVSFQSIRSQKRTSTHSKHIPKIAVMVCLSSTTPLYYYRMLYAIQSPNQLCAINVWINNQCLHLHAPHTCAANQWHLFQNIYIQFIGSETIPFKYTYASRHFNKKFFFAVFTFILCLLIPVFISFDNLEFHWANHR